MRIFDSHCHIDDKSYDDDFQETLDRAKDNRVIACMIVGITLKTCRKAVPLCEASANCFTSVGVHPHDAKSCSEKVLEKLRELAKSPKVKAWGETGLDFNRMFSPQDVQEKWFIRQIQMARETGLPLIIHERDTNGRLLEILRAELQPGQGGVVHCFSGTRDEMHVYLDMGFHIGITGVITHKARGKELRAMAPEIPDDRILVETDAPYLTPSPERNKFRRNEPAFVRRVLEKTAEVRSQDVDALADLVFNNTCRLYGISPDELELS
ncbi:TatD DNase family protein [Desulfatibacillum alkenivorans DSM 16219]|jgi:TatD DNase family protein|uniref:TatD DNase family protein n=1 Tax=Desulfatibacillum alkenivorans DSM 16219 TaxID=1121393 RepID=A0A1M6QLQ8_9BACT|nr:TatD family hydrolase [Desulfatibacillum alkenivorans]SHK21156.1 TatD DNase family protein [Desulfatibacillum alkenivorans DSM 16219]